jgi:hypothetical protein
MHRSGASALAGVVRSLGVAAPKTFTMPDSGNPSGYWESVPLANAHDELLASAGSRWNDWRQLNPEWIHSDAAQRFKERISVGLAFVDAGRRIGRELRHSFRCNGGNRRQCDCGDQASRD